ncbi:MAG: hypothetical protein PGN23_05175 [Sphingomonas adhaesiva]|uniref:hypothetical protein n=1 Tax=Sphingomonas adhaesiva TaxID=28212 RepID=UPI002FFD2202
MTDADTRPESPAPQPGAPQPGAPEPTAEDAFGRNSGPPIHAGIIYLGFLLVATMGILLRAGEVF